MEADPVPSRLRYATLAVLLIPLGVATKLYSGPGASWIGGNLGGSVYVAFWSALILAIRPSWSVRRVAVGVFVCTTGIEFLQLWHPPVLQALRGTLLGQAVLGGVFSWIDIPWYGVGAGMFVVLADALERRALPGSPGLWR